MPLTGRMLLVTTATDDELKKELATFNPDSGDIFWVNGKSLLALMEALEREDGSLREKTDSNGAGIDPSKCYEVTKGKIVPFERLP
jgi:hypothetical protein